MALRIQRAEGRVLRIYEHYLFYIRWINDELGHAGMLSFILSKALLLSRNTTTHSKKITAVAYFSKNHCTVLLTMKVEAILGNVSVICKCTGKKTKLKND